jgi:hypothetical protein
MENHPIPQDITGFQFKLIGNMTVKQFAYLGGGVLLAWIVFILPLPGIFRYPISILFAVLGISFAFVPVDGRPMDAMFGYLIKALFNPTQYIYQKDGGSLLNSTHSIPQEPAIIPTQQQPRQAAHHTTSSQPHNAPSHADWSHMQHPPQQPLKEDDQEEDNIGDEKWTENKAQLQETTQAIHTAEAETNKSKSEELEKLLMETVRQKEELEKELMSLRSRLDSQKKETFSPAMATVDQPVQAPKQTENVRSVPSGMEKQIGLPSAPEAPNLITGIIKDPRGNPLPNILVEVTDVEGSPVRAFKTNGLGHFASATSLSNGKYKVSFEDPKGENKFDSVELEATGEALLPLEIISIDSREELRRELFN